MSDRHFVEALEAAAKEKLKSDSLQSQLEDILNDPAVLSMRIMEAVDYLHQETSLPPEYVEVILALFSEWMFHYVVVRMLQVATPTALLRNSRWVAVNEAQAKPSVWLACLWVHTHWQ